MATASPSCCRLASCTSSTERIILRLGMIIFVATVLFLLAVPGLLYPGKGVVYDFLELCGCAIARVVSGCSGAWSRVYSETDW